VILLENSNEWNLSPAKEGSSKKNERKKEREKKRSVDWKAEEVKPHMNKLHVSKGKKEDEVYMLLRDILSKERRKGDHIFL
jgi:hypothetical protein